MTAAMVTKGLPQHSVPPSEHRQLDWVYPSVCCSVAPTLATPRPVKCGDTTSVVGRYTQGGAKMLKSAHQERAPPTWYSRSRFVHTAVKQQSLLSCLKPRTDPANPASEMKSNHHENKGGV